MSLYFVRHQHSPETCPAKDPAAGEMLIQHVNPTNARRHGIQLHGDAVLDGQHTFVLILEADEKSQVEAFMAPFQPAGPVEIWPASACEVVVDRQGC